MSHDLSFSMRMTSEERDRWEALVASWRARRESEGIIVPEWGAQSGYFRWLLRNAHRLEQDAGKE